MVRQTHTYADLEISPEAYAEIRGRIEALGGDYLRLYLLNDREGEGLTLPAVRLVPEKRAAEEGGDGGR
jgi:hypothetical protein